MAAGRGKSEWKRVSWLLAKIHNAHFTEPVQPQDFNPFAESSRMRDEIEVWTDDLSFMTPKS